MKLLEKINWIALLLWFILQPAVANSTPNLRLALVIGNASYKSAPLKNPSNDAKAIKQVLEDVGFKE